jgi:hypothetical protein
MLGFWVRRSDPTRNQESLRPQIFAVRYEAGEGPVGEFWRRICEEVSCLLKCFSEQDLIYSRHAFKAELLDTGAESRRLHGKQICRTPGSVNFEIAALESSRDIVSLPLLHFLL